MPIFAQSLQKLDESNPQESIKKMANHIRYIQAQLEHTLISLDSGNIIEIDIDKTAIGDSNGTTSIGSYINLRGNNGEGFTVGKNDKGNFEFSINAAGKKRVLFLDSLGILHIEDSAKISVDGGTW